MTRRQFFVALVVLFVGGVIGGAFNTWLMPGGPAWAQGNLPRAEDVPPADPGLSVVPNEVRAERFVLVDDAGQVRSVWETRTPKLPYIGQEGPPTPEPILAFFGLDGEECLHLSVTGSDLPGLEMYDGNGTHRIGLGLGLGGDPDLTFSAPNGSSCLSMSTWGGVPSFDMLQEGQAGSEIRASFSLNGDTPRLSFYGPPGNGALQAEIALVGGEPVLVFLDETETARVILGRMAGSRGLAICGPGGEIVDAFSVPAGDEEDDGGVRIYRPIR